MIRIFQTNLTNLLLQLDTKAEIYQQNGNEREYEVHSGKSELKIFASVPKFYKGKLTINDFQFSTTTYRLLIFLIEQFTEKGQTDFEFSIKEFMDKCGLKDRDNTKRIIEKDLFTLLCVRTEMDGKENFIIEDYEVGRGKFYVSLYEGFCGVLTAHKSYVNIPDGYFKIDLQKTPQAPGLLYYLVYLEYVNRNKTNKNRVAVSSLLVRGKFPTIEEVRQTRNHSVKERIIIPFFRSLNSLMDIAKFNYFTKSGRQLTEMEVQNLPYDEFSKIIIQYELSPKG